MNPPVMAGGNLALRFALELGALAGLGLAAGKLTSGPVRWAAVAAVPIAAAAVWGVFAVLIAAHYAASSSRIEWLIQQ